MYAAQMCNRTLAEATGPIIPKFIPLFPFKGSFPVPHALLLPGRSWKTVFV